MLSQQQVKDLIRDSLIALNDEKKDGHKIPISGDTVLLGSGTLLDSLDFVLVVTYIEERLHTLTGQEIQIGADLQEFNEDNPFRTTATLSDHIAAILQSEQPDG